MIEDHDKPIDLSALDPTGDSAAFDRIVGSITAAAADQLAARRANHDVIVLLARWRRPMMAAAAAAILVLGTVLATVRVPEAYVVPETDGIAEAMGVPAAVAEWIDAEGVPSTEELLTGY